MHALLLMTLAALPQQQDFSWSGDLRTGQRLAVENIIGDVRVEPSSGRRAEVVAVKKAGRHGDPDDVTITARESSRGVQICVSYPGTRRGNRDRDRDRDRARDDDGCDSGGGWGDGDNRNNRNDTEVQFVIRLPAGVELEAQTVSGSVFARGLRADADLASVSGDVEVTGFRGARLEATTVSGDVGLADVQARTVEAETVSGNVTFEGALDREGSYDLTTLSGRVLVTVPSGTGADYRASTFSGSIRMPAGATSESSSRRRNRSSGRIGAGGAALNLESFSGSVEVRVGTGS